ncbi:OLC1v1038848C1 [Oldenlandia corymbosa var. corymbosa]|uniref:DNA (cytosine-5)-methyltransferase n=1 Tax=Oldenlandia corymbosa var. corymbosa TaxID=529605 RepID=A0AAV1D0R1_OLDCO|nr:OLC1v1038848C1 [Oldenlandia corymbosa var. corymbosa]
MAKKKAHPNSRNVLSEVKNNGRMTGKRKRSDSDSIDSLKIPKQSSGSSISQSNSVNSTVDSTEVETEKIRSLEEEEDAVRLTRGGKEDSQQDRRLTAFTIHDEHGQPQPIELVEEYKLYISALILPLEDHDDEKETRIYCEGFGPILSWSLSGYDENLPIIWVSTQTADYECLKPSKVYQKHYDLFFMKASACIDVYRMLSKCCGGNPNIGLNDLATAVSHSWTEKSNVPLEGYSMDLFLSWGRFIYDQLIGLDDTSREGDTIFTNLPVLLALKDASEKSVGSVSRRKKSKRYMSEYDISDDYPPPTYYTQSIKEKDESSIFIDESDYDSDELPQYFLHNWCLYSSDNRFTPLELLPIKTFAAKDTKICCSGVLATDQGSVFCCDDDFSPSSSFLNGDGIPVHLSEIKQWDIKWRSSSSTAVSISIRTDTAWYMLGNPLNQYNPWYKPIEKIVTLAISIIKLLQGQRRASRLSFREVVEKVADFSQGYPSYISSDIATVQRYMLVHGQVILQLFADYHDPSISKCAFVRGLEDHLRECLLTKKVKKKEFQRKEINLHQEVVAQNKTPKPQPMPATTTKLVGRIWGKYCSNYLSNDSKEKDTKALKDKKVPFGTNVEKIHSLTRWRKSPYASTVVKWEGEQAGKTSSNNVLYKKAKVGRLAVHPGSSVIVETIDSKENPPIFYLEYLFENSDGKMLAHGRLMLRGHETVLGDSSNEMELFLTNHCLDFELCHVRGTVAIEMRSTLWGHKHRKANLNDESSDRASASKKKKKKLQVEFFCRNLYCPEKGAFLCLKPESMGLGNGHCQPCQIKESRTAAFFKLTKACFILKGTKYHIHDFIYLYQDHVTFYQCDQSSLKIGKNPPLKPFIICQILGIEGKKPFEKADPMSTILRLQRFYRPEEISADKAYHSDIREIYYSQEVLKMPVLAVQGKCELREKEDIHLFPTTYVYQHIFYCERSYDHQTGALKKLPPQVKRNLSRKNSVKAVVNRKILGKRKKAERTLDDIYNQQHSAQKLPLATLDIFSGCGGLSSGLEQSGVSKTKWAIEYTETTATAFEQNHPRAKMFNENCNVILRAIMAACGDADDCISTPEAAKLAAKLDKKQLNDLPRPGDVDFIIGGPPCQGFSKMNRYQDGSWSKNQCEMIPAFLSFADYFRPKFFLLENVRNFIFFNKGQEFRFTLAALLEMGYQVRFGILEAGAYGIPQNRKRAFVWAASPEENLPEWPEPMFVFKGSELKIPLGGDVFYAAAHRTDHGAPFRSITIKDAIGDLPPVDNDASEFTLEYENEPVSWYQRQIRGNMRYLNAHIPKKLNEINFLRCKKVQKRPGADWHDIPDKQVKLSNGKVVDLLPPWLPEKANRWKGLYGRLDWAGKFPTCVTDPQPMGKVGCWFHPQQDRLVTVREYARAQGFPDSYQFSGKIKHQHKQIGNAVPPPVAFALGRKLKEAVEKKGAS